jgi:hypothetical protein
MRRAYCAHAWTLVLVLASGSSVLALDPKGAAYVSGTIIQFNGVKEPIEGRLDITGDEAFVFTTEARPFAGQAFWIPYEQILSLEYGLKAGRRVLTIGYVDDYDRAQSAVIELGMDIVRSTLELLEARSGRKVDHRNTQTRQPG